MDPLAFSLAAVFSAVAFLFVASLFVRQRTHKHLRHEHAEVWRRIGSPGLLGFGALTSLIKYWGFFRDKDFLELGDPTLEKYCAANVRIGRASVALVIVLLALYVVQLARAAT